MEKFPEKSKAGLRGKYPLLVLAGLAFALILLEVISRLFLENPQTFQAQKLNQNSDNFLQKIGLEELDFYYETKTGLRFIPNIKGTIKNHYISKKDVQVSTNSLGFRSKELPQKTQNDFRILVLGDSITAGDYLDEEKTYPALLESFLKTEKPEDLKQKNIEVINAGIASTGAGSQIALLTEKGLTLKPDLILVGMYLNDAQDSLNLKAIKVPPLLQKIKLINMVFEKLNLIIKNEKFSKTAEPVFDKAGRAFIENNQISSSSEQWSKDPKAFNSLIFQNFKDWGFSFTDEFWEKEENQFKILKTISENNKAKLMFVLFPVRYQVESEILNNFPQQKFEEKMSQLNITHLDLLSSLREKFASNKESFYYDQAHPTEEGMKFIASELSAFVKTSLK